MSAEQISHAALPTITLSDKLRLAASKGQIDKVQELVQSGASFQPDKDGRSALHYAALNGYTDVCKYLISEQCPLDIQDASGFTALHRAASQGHIEVIRCLLEEGCAIDRQDEHGNAALHEASWNGFSSALELLIKHNCNVVVTNKAGFTALHLSAQNGHNQSTRVLLYGGCNPDLKNNYGDTALHTAARYGHAGVTRILISARCCLNEQNKNGDTALHISSALKRRKIAKLLVEAKIDVYIKNKQNESACDVARRKDHPEIIMIITSLSRSKTPKPSQQHHQHPQKEVNFKEVPVDMMDGPVVVPDKDMPIKKDSKEKSRFSFFKKKKPKQEKEKGIEMKTMTSPSGQNGEKSVKGFFSQYVPRPGNQYYRDLAGNIKQGPIGYTPICHCAPALHRLEQQLHNDHDNIYQHMDASNKVLHNRIDQLDKRTAQQVFAIDKLTKERLLQEEQGCHNRINRRFEEERMYNNNHFEGQMEQLLEAKLSSYGHCLDHHHDDSALPSNNIFTNIHETANGRLFKSRSDETLSQSDYSGKFRKKQFYESRQAAMQQMRAWQVPNVNEIRQSKERERLAQAKTVTRSQGQIYSKPGQVVGQIQVHASAMRDNAKDNSRVAVNGSQYDILSPSTASTSCRTPNVQSPMDPVTPRQDFSSQGAIPKRLIPHSHTWHNSQQFRDSGVHREPSPLNHSTPKSRESSPYEVMHAVTRPGNAGMVRSHTDSEGLHRATQQRQSFPERGSSNTSTGTNQTSNPSGAGQGPQVNQGQSSTITREGDGGKPYESKPTFTTFGYPDNVETRLQSSERTESDDVVDHVHNRNSNEECNPRLRPGSSLREESPYGPYPLKPEVPKKPEVLRKPDMGYRLTSDNVKEDGDHYGYFIRNKDDQYMSMHQQQKSITARQRTRSSDGILLDEAELTSAHEMAKVERLRLQQNHSENRNTSAMNQNYNGHLRSQQNQGYSGQGQRYPQGQWSNHQRPPSTRPSEQGQYFGVTGRSQGQAENQFTSAKEDPRYVTRESTPVDRENQYMSSKDVAHYRRDSSHRNSPVRQGAPYHSTYYVDRAGQNEDHVPADNMDKNKCLSKSESNLMERTSDYGNSPRDFSCRTPVTGIEDSPRDKELKSMANYPNAYNKEDSSSNPDSGYSSKIFGNRLHPGVPRSASGTPSFNSTSPSFNSGTPSSSFSADHSMSTPGQSHTNSPSIHVSHPDYEQIPQTRDHYNQNLKSHVNNWYQRQLQEAAHRLHDGTYTGSPQKQYHVTSSQTTNKPLQGNNKYVGQPPHQPHYGQNPPPQQYGSQSSYGSTQGYHGNQTSYANQHISSFVRGSDV